VTLSISIRIAARPRPAKLHFAAVATFAYLFAASAHGQEDPGGTPAEAAGDADASSEAPTQSGDATVADEPAGDTGTETEGDDSGAVVSSGGGLFESGASATTPEAGAEAPSAVSFDLGGYTRGDVFVGVIPGTGEVGINAAYGELSLQANAKAGSWGSAFADFRMRYGQQLSQNDLFLDLRESYVNAYLGPLDIRLGKQIIVWGRADAFNPTSNITPVDFRIRSPIEDDRRMGNVGARVFLNLLPVRIEAVWMPLYSPTIYPDVALDPVVTMTDPNYPSLSIKKGLGAGRVHLELPSFEASVSYLFGEALLPGFALAGITANTDDPATPEIEPGEIRVTRTSYNHHVIGADFSTAIGDLFGLRGETAFRSPVDQANRPWAAKPDLQWVLGVDREFGDVMLIVQYLGRYTFNWTAPYPESDIPPSAICCTTYEEALPRAQQGVANSNQMIFSQLHQLQSLASVRVEWKTMHDKLSLSALGVLNFNTQEWALMPKVAYQITEGLTAYAGGEIFVGPDGTLFGMIDESLTAGYTELRLTF
jgi:hypothetical protein